MDKAKEVRMSDKQLIELGRIIETDKRFNSEMMLKRGKVWVNPYEVRFFGAPLRSFGEPAAQKSESVMVERIIGNVEIENDEVTGDAAEEVKNWIKNRGDFELGPQPYPLVVFNNICGKNKIVLRPVNEPLYDTLNLGGKVEEVDFFSAPRRDSKGGMRSNLVECLGLPAPQMFAMYGMHVHLEGSDRDIIALRNGCLYRFNSCGRIYLEMPFSEIPLYKIEGSANLPYKFAVGKSHFWIQPNESFGVELISKEGVDLKGSVRVRMFLDGLHFIQL